MRRCSSSHWKNTISLWLMQPICYWELAWMMLCPPSWSKYSHKYLAELSPTAYPHVKGVISRPSHLWLRNSTRTGNLSPLPYPPPSPFPFPPPTDLTLHLTGILRQKRNPHGGRLSLIQSGGRYPSPPLTITHGLLL